MATLRTAMKLLQLIPVEGLIPLMDDACFTKEVQTIIKAMVKGDL